MTVRWLAEPWDSLPGWAAEVSVVWGAAAVGPDLKASGFPSERKSKARV
jgi:hypothetical protein